MKVIAVNNNKGGSLKTTTATNLAGVLAAEGKRILIIDSDNQSNVTLSFGQNPDTFTHGLYDVLVNGLHPFDATVNVHDHIDILPATDDLIGFDFEVIGNPRTYKHPFSIMKKTCSPLLEAYDYIFVDTPPSLSLMVGNVFAFADAVLIPFSPESYSMRSLVKVLGTIEDFKEQYNPSLRVLGVVGTMVNFQTVLHQEIMQETRRYCAESDVHMFDSYIPRSIRFASSVAYEKVPASLSKKSNEIAKGYFNLWKEIDDHEQTT